VLELLDSQTCGLSAIEIEDALRAGGRPVGRASVYRILDELERLGLVQKLQVGQAMARYEPVRPGEGHHHHLVCDSCGAVTPFTDAELESAIEKLSERVPMHVEEHEIILHGACRDCSG
jgi:Fur family ferric uptake transcriptional regulator